MDIDEDINTNDTSTPAPPPLGPITRARARQLNHQVSSFLTFVHYIYTMETHVLLFCLGMMERIRRGAALRTGFGQQDNTNL